MLTLDRLRSVLDYDEATGVFRWRSRPGVQGWSDAKHIGSVAGSVTRRGYRNISVDDRLYKAHHLAWLWAYERWPVKQIDHIDGLKDNNSIANLREATQTEQSRNVSVSARSKSGVIGVTPYPYNGRDLWAARIRVDGRLKHLGYFATVEEAAAARKKAERDYGFHPNHGRSRTPMRRSPQAGSAR